MTDLALTGAANGKSVDWIDQARSNNGIIHQPASPGLSRRDRRVVTLATLIARNHSADLQQHVGLA